MSRLWLCNLCYHTIFFNGFISLGVMVSFVTFNEFVEAFLVALIPAPCCWGTNEIWSLSIPLLYQNFSLSKLGMNAMAFTQQKVDILYIEMNGVTTFTSHMHVSTSHVCCQPRPTARGKTMFCCSVKIHVIISSSVRGNNHSKHISCSEWFNINFDVYGEEFFNRQSYALSYKDHPQWLEIMHKSVEPWILSQCLFTLFLNMLFHPKWAFGFKQAAHCLTALPFMASENQQQLK